MTQADKTLLQASYEEAAFYLKENAIPSAVLHGIDPITGEIGRDLDLFIPDAAAAAQAALAFAEILKRNGFRWITVVDPIWGHRCAGVALPDYGYCELHLISELRYGPIDFGTLFEQGAREMAYGFCFDPALWFTKSCLMKYSSALLKRQPLWNKLPPNAFTIKHRSEIGERYQKHWRRGQELVAAVLAEDTAATLAARKSALWGVLSEHCAHNPLSAAQSIKRWLTRKVARYAAPCVPAVCLITSRPCTQVRDELQARLGRVFGKIQVSATDPGALARRELQSRQSLFIHCSRDPAQCRSHGATIRAGGEGGKEMDMDWVCGAILDAFVDFNRSWGATYANQARAMRK